MFYHNLNPVFLDLGFIEIRYYGLIYALSFVIGYFIVKYMVKKKRINLKDDDISDLLLYELIGIVVGARIGSIISNLSYYLQNPAEIIAVWHGGMAFHGGLLGAIVAGYIFSKRKNVDFMQIADLIVIPAALGLALGRIGNFINGEFYGTVTNLPWGVKFQNVEGFRHPVQIYESLKNFLIFGVLWFLKDKNLPKGALFWGFVLMYGSLRFVIEFWKDLPHYFLNLTWGQFWSVPMIIVGAYMLFRLRK